MHWYQGPLSRCADRLHPVLWVWAALWALPHLFDVGVSWHFFRQGSVLIGSDGPGAGLHLYAAHPDLQIGPLTFLAARPLVALPPAVGEALAITFMMALGPALLLSLRHLMGGQRQRRDIRVLLAGLVLLPGWDELAVHYAHLDDALALALAVCAVHAVARDRSILAAVLLAAAADAKPWAAAFVALLLVFRGRRLRAAGAVWAAGTALAWVPFLVGDPSTLGSLRRFTIPVSPSSALHVLGVNAVSTPGWDRPAQLVLGVGLGWLLVRRGRWPGVLIMAVCARVLLDPGTYPYYTAGVLLAALVFDLLVTRALLPVTALLGATFLYLVRFQPLRLLVTQHDLAGLRAVFVGAAVLLTLTLPGRDGPLRPAATIPNAPHLEPSGDDTVPLPRTQAA